MRLLTAIRPGTGILYSVWCRIAGPYSGPRRAERAEETTRTRQGLTSARDIKGRALVWLLALAAAAGVAVGAQKIERPGIANFTKVDAVVACGGATETAALEGLKNDGFKAVINLRQASESGANIEENAARANALGLTYIHIPFNTQAPETKTVDDFLAAVNNKAHQPVFIHCASANRVGAVWLVKRVLQDGWTVNKATEEAKMIGLRSAPLEQFALKYIEEHKK